MSKPDSKPPWNGSSRTPKKIDEAQRTAGDANGINNINKPNNQRRRENPNDVDREASPSPPPRRDHDSPKVICFLFVMHSLILMEVIADYCM